jgi:transposase
VDDYGAIRRARRDGKSIRQIASEFQHSRNTIRKILKPAEPNPLPATRDRLAPLLGPVQAVIDQILIDDETAPPKQRHTAAQLFRRLRDQHGYRGGYAQVQRYLRKRRRSHQETFIPLGHLPGQRLEADFGHIYVDFPEGRRQIPFLVTAWSYSNAPFVLALPFERTEAILEGMVAAFEFFQAVPREVWWDNPKTVATLILPGRQRQLHPRYNALATHYVFDPRFCLPARGQEKPDAEGTVKAVQRRFATPVPRVANLDELNTFFRKCCEVEQQRVVQSLLGPFVIADRLAEDRAAALPLPPHRFDPCVIRPAVVVDKYQTIAFDNNRYSVPRPWGFEMVTVKGYVNTVAILAAGQVIATHARCLDKHKMIIDPIHYLAILGSKPGVLDCAPAFRDWSLPTCFAEFRTALEQLHGAMAGTRRFVRVLQLLIKHPLMRVRRVVEECRRAHLIDADAVIQRTHALAANAALVGESVPPVPVAYAAAGISVPLPDLSRFDQLLGGAVPDQLHNDIYNTKNYNITIIGPSSGFGTGPDAIRSPSGSTVGHDGSCLLETEGGTL